MVDKRENLQGTQGRAFSAGEDTGRDARGWERAGRGIGGGVGSIRGIRRILGVNSASEESGESDVFDEHYREYSWRGLEMVGEAMKLGKRGLEWETRVFIQTPSPRSLHALNGCPEMSIVFFSPGELSPRSPQKLCFYHSIPLCSPNFEWNRVR